MGSLIAFAAVEVAARTFPAVFRPVIAMAPMVAVLANAVLAIGYFDLMLATTVTLF